MHGDPTLRALDIVDLETVDDSIEDTQYHYTRGKYAVMNIEHIIIGGTYMTNLTLFRRHAYMGSEEAVGRNKVAIDRTKARAAEGSVRIRSRG